MLKRMLILGLFIVGLCSVADSAQAQQQFFPPTNIAECQKPGGALLYWDGTTGVKCINIATCPTGQMLMFLDGTLKCGSGAVANSPCTAGKIALQSAGDAQLGVHRGRFYCCNPTATSIGDASCTIETVPLTSCLPSGYPNGQPNDGYLNPALPTAPQGMSTSCGVASGYNVNCCSHQSSWQQQVSDSWGTLTRHGTPVNGSYYLCTCR
ncbi:MAG: hypothetical protein WAO98_11035 [Alphaproteobacteria bacterium]